MSVLQLLSRNQLSPKIKGVAMVTVGHFRVDLSCISAVEAGL